MLKLSSKAKSKPLIFLKSNANKVNISISDNNINILMIMAVSEVLEKLMIINIRTIPK